MKKKRVSVIRKRGVIAGAVCLCLLFGAVMLQQAQERQSREDGQAWPAESAGKEEMREQSAESTGKEEMREQSAESTGKEEMREQSAESAGREEPGEQSAESAGQKNQGAQEDRNPGSESTGTVSAEGQNSRPQEQVKPGGSEDSAAETQSSRTLKLTDIQVMPAGSILDASAFSQEFLDSLFCSQEISEDLRQRIWGVSYQENDSIALSELRYMRVLHVGFDGETHIGELMVHQSIAEDILEIMSELYRQNYPIEKMLLIDEYGADDESSMSDNNTSAFNYREIAGSSRLSRHALGLAIDINPRYNPYVKQTGDGEVLVSPANGGEYADRSREFPYKIAEGDLCLQLFAEHGFAWGGYWNSVKDYQHFEK